MESQLPIITIITSTFNAVKDLPYTINSIRHQTYQRIQWIIADGGSKDGTLELINENQDIVDTWFSKPDKGIYDAWNKAIPYIKGEWVVFIGAGDELANEFVMEKVAHVLGKTDYIGTYELVYGDLDIINEYSRMVVDEIRMPWPLIKGTWTVCLPTLPVHPSVFHHKSLFNLSNPFDTKYKLVSDAHFMVKSLLEKDPLYIPILIDRMPLGGVTGQIGSFFKTEPELKMISQSLNLEPPLLHKIKVSLKFKIKKGLFLIFGEQNVKYIADAYRFFRGKKKKWSI